MQRWMPPFDPTSCEQSGPKSIQLSSVISGFALLALGCVAGLALSCCEHVRKLLTRSHRALDGDDAYMGKATAGFVRNEVRRKSRLKYF